VIRIPLLRSELFALVRAKTRSLLTVLGNIRAGSLPDVRDKADAATHDERGDGGIDFVDPIRRVLEEVRRLGAGRPFDPGGVLVPIFDQERLIAKTVEEMTDDEVVVVEARMRPQAYSATGFLSHGESLRETAERDLRDLEDMGVSVDRFAEALEGMIERVGRRLRKGTDGWIPLGEGIEARVYLWMGHQNCPFGPMSPHAAASPCALAGDDLVLRSPKGTLLVSGLLPHLIRVHHFFEGREVPYRLDPIMGARVLGLVT
jgi:hypothetical protein